MTRHLLGALLCVFLSAAQAQSPASRRGLARPVSVLPREQLAAARISLQLGANEGSGHVNRVQLQEDEAPAPDPALAPGPLPLFTDTVYVHPPDAAILLKARKIWRAEENLGSWDVGSPCSWWEGVECDDDGRVSRLQLIGYGLTGHIPASLGGLDGLTWFELSVNKLTGPLPASIGNLTALQRVYMYLNKLTGPIPTSVGTLTRLVAFGVDWNRMSGSLPANIGNLTGLIDLGLGPNRFSGSLPSSWGSLTGLHSLKLFDTQLSGSLPSSMGNWIELTYLRMSSNRLSGPLPASLGGLTALQFLWLQNNSFTGPIPSSFSSLKNLTSLDLSNNSLTGPLPVLPPGALAKWKLSNNLLSGKCPSKRLLSGLYGNCFRACSRRGMSKMRSQDECSRACGSDQARGPCQGRGTCFIDRRNAPKCVCNPGFISPALNPGTCETAPPPPPPGYAIKPCAGAQPNPKRCKCPAGARCLQKRSCRSKFVCRCVGAKRTPVADPKTGLLKACI